jgi:hypothetical protein
MAHTLPPGARDGDAGFALLDTCMALALTSLAALLLLSGLRPLACAASVEAARSTVVNALLEARRSAYAAERTVALEARRDGTEVVLQPGGKRRALGTGVRLSAAPADGDVEFRASGLSDNATLTVACGEAMASVVVNQRGVVR